MPKVVGSDRTVDNNGDGLVVVTGPAWGSISVYSQFLQISGGTGWPKTINPSDPTATDSEGPLRYGTNTGSGGIKWGNPQDNSYLPPDTPTIAGGSVYLVNPTYMVFWDGNSNTKADTLSASKESFRQLAYYDSRFDKDDWLNIGAGANGQTLSAMVTTALAGYPAYGGVGNLIPNVDVAIFAAQEAINYVNGGASLSDLQTAFIDYCAAIHGLGANCKVVFQTSLGGGVDSGKVAILDAFDTWLKANWATYCDALVDVTSVPHIRDCYTTPNAYWDDLFHPNAPIDAYLGPLWAEAILQVAGLAGTVTSVVIDQGNQTLYGGQQVDFTATVTVTGGAPQTVTWSTDGGNIDASNGTFTAPGGEFSGSQHITVTATSTFDGTKTGQVTVTVPRHAPGGAGRAFESWPVRLSR